MCRVEKLCKVIAVDFDGTLCINRFPLIGKPKKRVIRRVLREQSKGAKIILWTCRDGETLRQAIEWCNTKQGLYFDAVNENLPEQIKYFNNDCRKIGATEYWDDKARRVR